MLPVSTIFLAALKEHNISSDILTDLKSKFSGRSVIVKEDTADTHSIDSDEPLSIKIKQHPSKYDRVLSENGGVVDKSNEEITTKRGISEPVNICEMKHY